MDSADQLVQKWDADTDLKPFMPDKAADRISITLAKPDNGNAGIFGAISPRKKDRQPKGGEIATDHIRMWASQAAQEGNGESG